jgi:hypothetical protein
MHILKGIYIYDHQLRICTSCSPGLHICMEIKYYFNFAVIKIDIKTIEFVKLIDVSDQYISDMFI